MKSTSSGFTLVEITIAVAVVGLMAAIAVPSFKSARTKSRDNAKKNNVRLINSAVEQWAMQEFKNDRSPIGPEIGDYIRGGLESLDVGSSSLKISNITARTVGYTFTVEDLYGR